MDQTTADLNNAAVVHLERGDLGQALGLFRRALRQTMGHIRPVSQPPVAPPPMPRAAQESDSDRSSSSSNSSSTSASTEGETPPQTDPADFNITGIPFIHAQGFGIVGTPGAYASDPLVNTTIVATIVIFNLAIVCHIKGMHEEALSDSRLYKAHSLYAKAHLLLHDAGVSYGCTGNAVVDLLSMAVSNNLAHVCYELSSYDESRSYFDSLIRFARTVVPTRYGDQYVGSVMDQQKPNFLLNAIILHSPNLAPAA